MPCIVRQLVVGYEHVRGAVNGRPDIGWAHTKFVIGTQLLHEQRKSPATSVTEAPLHRAEVHVVLHFWRATVEFGAPWVGLKQLG